jgi:hypothetical protein
MLKLFNNNFSTYHRFQYHARFYKEEVENLQERRVILENLRKDSSFCIIAYHNEKKKKTKSVKTSVWLGISFFLCLFYAPEIADMLKSKHKYGELGVYFLLILLGLAFTKSSKKKHV